MPFLLFYILGLNEYTTFRVSVAANNLFGIGPYSQPVEVKTQESSKSIVMFVFLQSDTAATILFATHFLCGYYSRKGKYYCSIYFFEKPTDFNNGWISNTTMTVLSAM